MTPPRDSGRLHRSFAAVESRYVRDLGHRELRPSRAVPATARQHSSASKRLDVTHRRARAGWSVHSRHPARG
jgi:hypothetical protein